MTLLSLMSFSLLCNINDGILAQAKTNAGAEKPETFRLNQEKKISEEEARELLYQAPESNALTKTGEKELKKHYIEKYMPVEGCSLVEELPKTSDIHYVPPKPKPKPKPKIVKVVKKKKKIEIKKLKTIPKVTTVKKELRTIASEKKKEPSKPVVQEKEQRPYDTGKSLSMTAEERLWLEKLVEAESGGEPYEGRVAVATIIANRVAMPEFPNTVMEVIRAPKQFSPFIDGSINSKVPSSETKRAVAEVFDNGVRTLPAEATYFCTTAIASSSWIGQTRPFIKTIGNHSFYKK